MLHVRAKPDVALTHPLSSARCSMFCLIRRLLCVGPVKYQLMMTRATVPRPMDPLVDISLLQFVKFVCNYNSSPTLTLVVRLLVMEGECEQADGVSGVNGGSPEKMFSISATLLLLLPPVPIK